MPRHGFDGGKLGEDVARLAAADEASPPAARPSLMDAVRALAPFIATRTRLNWGDAKIAAVLSAAGYPIDAATLRSYRKRLRDEGLLPPLPVKAANQTISPIVQATPGPPPAPRAPPATATAPVQGEVGVDRPATSIARPQNDGATSRAPPERTPSSTPAKIRHFSIDPTKRPLDRA